MLVEHLCARLGPPQPFTLHAKAEGESDATAFTGWRVGFGKAPDAPDSPAIKKAISIVELYVTIDGDWVSALDHQPLDSTEIPYGGSYFYVTVHSSLFDAEPWIMDKTWNHLAALEAIRAAELLTEDIP